MDKEQIKDYWFNFLRDKNSLYYPLGDITVFGSEGPVAEELSKLVYDGVKTATSSSYELYEPTEYMPQVGDYNIILNGKNEPICITETLVTEVVSFKQISAEHAYHEGEGDRTLDYWRQVHEDFFTKEYQAAGKEFNEDIPVLCEVFKRVY